MTWEAARGGLFAGSIGGVCGFVLLRFLIHFSKTSAATSPADAAVRELLFLAAIEGMQTLSRGGKGCVFRAVEALRPDIAKLWADGADPHELMHRFFPEDR